MSIGSIANAAFAYQVIYNVKIPLSTEERVMLLLLAEGCSAGFGQIDLSAYAVYAGLRDGDQAHEAMKGLARHGLIKVSDNEGGEVAVALAIAEPKEIARARQHLGCDFEFRDWGGPA